MTSQKEFRTGLRRLIKEKNMSEQNLKYTCCFCGRPFYGYGNNAEPVIKNGICCDECNLKKVIPARIKQLKGE
jgi:DNA-directed RNA polymerase subunit RPC12/RpoP